MEMNNLGKKKTTGYTTFGKGIPIIPEQKKKQGLRGSL